MSLKIQGITDRTSNSACLALLGILPIKYILNKKLLNLFVNMIRDESHCLIPHLGRLGNIYSTAGFMIMVEAAWKTDIENKSSTKYLNPLELNVGSSHHIWSTSTVRDNIHDSRRAQIKCKILTGTYILEANMATVNQYSVNPTCKLCCRDPEAR